MTVPFFSLFCVWSRRTMQTNGRDIWYVLRMLGAASSIHAAISETRPAFGLNDCSSLGGVGCRAGCFLDACTGERDRLDFGPADGATTDTQAYHCAPQSDGSEMWPFHHFLGRVFDLVITPINLPNIHRMSRMEDTTPILHSRP